MPSRFTCALALVFVLISIFGGSAKAQTPDECAAQCGQMTCPDSSIAGVMQLCQMSIDRCFENCKDLLGQDNLQTGQSLEAAPAELAAPAAPKADCVKSEAAEAWLILKDSRDSDDLQAFIERFGNTFYGDLARRRLEKLSAQPKGDSALEGDSAIEGRYAVTGTYPDGRSYAGSATVTKLAAGEYRIDWIIGSQRYQGSGKFTGGQWVVDWGAPTPVIYRLGPDRVLRGTWADGQATDILTPLF